MKKRIFFSIFLVLMIFLIDQNVFAETEEEKEIKELVNDAANSLKRENTRSDTIASDDESEKKDKEKIKKKLSKLKKFLPTEKELDEITLRTVWRYVDKQSELDDKEKIEVIQALARDIGRVYDPVVNKYKVATIQMEIIKFNDFKKLEKYWSDKKNSSLKNLYDNAYLVGKPNEMTECLFNYSNDGAMTICKTNGFMIQSIIYDKYQEHYAYAKPQTGFKKLELNQDEITTRIVDIILGKIQNNTEIKNNKELYMILESNREIIQREQNKENKEREEIERTNEQNKFIEEKNKNKQLGIEKDKKYGIQNFSCLKDEFGLITISGQYNNNQIKKDKVVMEILFLDYDNEVIFKNKANLLEIDKFETKRFLGNLKINENFSTCTIQIKN